MAIAQNILDNPAETSAHVRPSESALTDEREDTAEDRDSTLPEAPDVALSGLPAAFRRLRGIGKAVVQSVVTYSEGLAATYYAPADTETPETAADERARASEAVRPETASKSHLAQVRELGRGLGKAVLRPLVWYRDETWGRIVPSAGDQTELTLVSGTGHEVAAVKPEQAALAEVLHAGEFVKHAPRFRDQVRDTSRTQIIESIAGSRYAHGTDTNSSNQTVRLTEHESLDELESFLVAATRQLAGTHSGELAASMLEHLTFIGRPEYNEATEAIATTWKAYLRAKPEAQLCAIVGYIDRSSLTKSDAFLLDNVLARFSDDEMEEFAGRLVTNPDDITAYGENVRVVMLDDWIVSGSQLRSACGIFGNDHPDLIDHLQVQVIAAPEKPIRDGLEVSFGNSWSGTDRTVQVPVAAYFVAHPASDRYAHSSHAHITGWHCSVDYDYNSALVSVAGDLGRDMPPTTNVVRPYRRRGVQLTQRERLERSRRQPEALAA